jgi:hypothetical protein
MATNSGWSSLLPSITPGQDGWWHALVDNADHEAIKGAFIFLIGAVFVFSSVVVLVQTLWAWWFKQRPYLAVLRGSDSRELIRDSRLPLLQNLQSHLVSVNTRDGSDTFVTQRTVDASDVMPQSLLVPSFIYSRLILAVPSILTGIGVLGTFTGLALGMSQIQVDGKNIDQISNAIQPMIGSFAGAFSCSVWGILASLLFSGIEKSCETVSLWSVAKIHLRIDQLFTRYVPEEVLAQISESGRQTSEILTGLAVAIGDQMQQAIGRLGSEIKDAVASATKEGQQPLADAAAKLLTDNLTAELINLKTQIDSMADRFSESFGGVSSNLLESIQGFQPAVLSLSGTVQTASSTVNNAVEKLNSHELVMSEMAEAARNINEAASTFGSMRSTLENSAAQNQSAADAQSKASSESLRAAAEFSKIASGLSEIQETIKQGAEVIGSLGGPIRELRLLLETLPEQQKKIDNDRSTAEQTRNDRILEMSSGLAEKVGEAATKFAEVGELAAQLSDAAKSLDAASGKLSDFGDSISAASTQQSKASEMGQKAAIASENTARVLEPIPRQIANLAQGLDAAGQSVRGGAEAARQSYEQLIVLQKQWFDGAERGLQVMRQSLQEVFANYGKQVQGKTGDLMNQWTEKVNECLQAYETQLGQMIGGVEEIQVAIQKLQTK